MFPVALVHHIVCSFCHSGLAQLGTFLLVVVLNLLLWACVWRWRRGQHSGEPPPAQTLESETGRRWLPCFLVRHCVPSASSVGVLSRIRSSG